MTPRPPSARGVSVRVPSWAWVMLRTMARPRPTPEWSSWIRPVPRWNGSTSVETSWRVSCSPVFSTVSTAVPALDAGRDPHACRPRRGCGRSRCGRGSSSAAAAARGSRGWAPGRRWSRWTRPRCSARGRSVSVASSATRDRSTGSRVKDPWSARLSRSRASVRSMARVLTKWRRSTSSPLSRVGSLRATSSSVWVIASGVRSSWEALAANRCCSATSASSRASMVSKASASSRNSS